MISLQSFQARSVRRGRAAKAWAGF
jgi:hypothetical protein